MKRILALLSLIILPLTATAQVVYEGADGPGKGKHIVLISGDEEYRSEEALPMLGKLLSQRHGFKCSVLFSMDADGTINPNNGTSVTGIEALDSADLCILLLRFRHWPDAQMKHFDDYLKSGKPIIALRTSTHAFNITDKASAYGKYSWTASEATGWKGGFGKAVLGETWVSHWGVHKKEATKGIIQEAAASDPILRGVSDLFGDTDVYEAAPPPDAKILVRGQVLTGMTPDSAPADYEKKDKSGKVLGKINDPMQPVIWTREFMNEAGSANKILCSTMGSATDLKNEGLRRLVVNACYTFAGLEVPERASAEIVGDYVPTFYGFDGFIKGVKPEAHVLK